MNAVVKNSGAKKINRKWLRLAVLGVTAFPVAAHAMDINWLSDTAVSNDMNDPLNWDAGQVPVAGDNAHINQILASSQIVAINLAGNSFSADNVDIGRGDGVFGLAVHNGVDFTVGNALSVGRDGATDSSFTSNGTGTTSSFITWIGAGTSSDGSIGSVGEVVVSSGAFKVVGTGGDGVHGGVGFLQIGRDNFGSASNGLGLLTVTGGTVSVTERTSVGWNGTGRIDHTGGTMNLNDLWVGRNGGTGTVNTVGDFHVADTMALGSGSGAAVGIMTQSGGSFTVGNEFIVGAEGQTGHFTQTGGTSSSNVTFVGRDFATGTFDMSPGTSHTTNELRVGAWGGGNGTMYQDNSAVTVNNEMWVGLSGDHQAGNSGHYELTGASTLNVGNWLSVGRDGGTGTFIHSGTGDVNVGRSLQIGRWGNNVDSGSKGTVSITNGGRINVNTVGDGQSDQGILAVGVDNSADGHAGTGGFGTLNVDNGTVTLRSSRATVGWRGEGTMNIGVPGGATIGQVDLNRNGGDNWGTWVGRSQDGVQGHGHINVYEGSTFNVSNGSMALGSGNGPNDPAGNGFLDQYAGSTVNVWADLHVGIEGKTGVYHMHDGTLNHGTKSDFSWASVGRGGGTGHFIMDAGEYNERGWLNVGVEGGSVGTFDQNGGNVISYTVDINNVQHGDWGFLNVGRGGGTGTYNLNGGSVVLGTDVGGGYTELYVGQDGGSHGELNIANGTTFTLNGYSNIGRDGGIGVVNNHGDFNNTQELRIGLWEGKGTFNNYEGNVNMGGNEIRVGMGSAGAEGHLNMLGPGTITAPNSMWVGRDGNGVGYFDQKAGTFSTTNAGFGWGTGHGHGTINDANGFAQFNVSNEFNVGRSGGSTGDLTITHIPGQPGTDVNLAYFAIGREGGTGYVYVGPGVELAAGETWVGENPGSNGTYIVDGAHIDMNASPNGNPWFNVGRGGTGYSEIKNGAFIDQGNFNDNRMLIGWGNGASGVGTVDVRDSGLANTGVLATTTVNVYRLEVGRADNGYGGTGTFNLHGGIVNIGRELLVGINNSANGAGVGVVNLNGGVMTTNTANVGSWTYIGQNGGTGIVNVNAGAVLDVGNRLHVGAGGNAVGILNVNGGTLNQHALDGNADADIILSDGGSTGTLNINGGLVTTQLGIHVAHWDGGTGILNINETMGATLVNIGQELHVGENHDGAPTANGFMTMDAGTVNVGTNFNIGSISNAGNGTVVHNGGSINVTGAFNVGTRSNGSYVQGAAATLTVGPGGVNNSVIGGGPSGVASINGTLNSANVFVENAGVLSGNGGTINGLVTVHDGGKISPGSGAVGILAVNGDVSFNTGLVGLADFALDLPGNVPGVNSSTLQIRAGFGGTGALNVNGGVLVQVTDPNGNLGLTTPGNEYVLVDYDPGYTGIGVQGIPGFGGMLLAPSPNPSFKLVLADDIGNHHVILTVLPDPREWERDGGGLWSSPGSWLLDDPTDIPDSPGEPANFLHKLVTAGNAPALVDVDGAFTAGVIRFDNSLQYIVGSTSGGSLTLETLGGPAGIQDINGSHEIQVPITLNNDLIVSVSNAGDTLTLSGALVSSSGQNVLKQGPGTLLVSGGVNLGAGTLFQEGGTIVQDVNDVVATALNFRPGDSSYTVLGGNLNVGAIVDNSGVGVSKLTLLGGAANTGNVAADFLIINGGTLNTTGTVLAGQLEVGTNGLVGAHNVGGGQNLQVAGNSIIGANGGNGTLILSSGTFNTSGQLHVGNAGDGTVITNGGTMNVNGQAYVGVNGGHGVFIQDDARDFNNVGNDVIQYQQGLNIGDGVGSVGEYTLTGANSWVHGTSNIGVNGGEGHLTIDSSSGAPVLYEANGGQFIGRGVGSVGTVDHYSTGGVQSEFWSNGSSIVVGFEGGQGTYNLHSGRMAANGDLIIGYNGGKGLVTMDDGLIFTDGWIYVGLGVGADNSEGKLVINGGTVDTRVMEVGRNVAVEDQFANAVGRIEQHGGVVQTRGEGWIRMGASPGTYGEYIIDGGAVRLANDGFFVGAHGKGYLKVSGTAEVTYQSTGGNQGIEIGRWGPHVGSTLEQDGGSVTSHLHIIVGHQGEGHYNISGGTVEVIEAGPNSGLRLGQERSGDGFMEVSGTADVHARWIGVGEEGRGTMTINGGTVRTDNEMPIGNWSRNGAYGKVDQHGGDVNVGQWMSLAREGPTGEQLSNGTYTMDESVGAATLTVGTDLYVGEGGDGHFTQDAGKILVNGFLDVARGGSASGVYDFNGGSLTVNAAIISSRDTGVFNINADLIAGPSSITTPLIQMGTINIGNAAVGKISATGRFINANTINVEALGTLAGTSSAGSLTGNVVSNGGTIQPGDSVGTLEVAGNMTLNLGSTINVELGTSSDLIVVTGDLGVGGTTHINVSDSGGFGAGTYVVIDYGTFSGLLSNFDTPTAPAGFSCSVVDSGTSIDLNCISAGPPDVVWDVNGGGTWGLAANWFNPIVPDAAGAKARFLEGPPHGLASGAVAHVTADGARTVGLIQFANTIPGASYSIDGPGSLTIDGGGFGGPIGIDVISGTHSINIPVAVVDNATASIAGGAQLNMTDVLAIGAGKTLNKTGPGVLNSTSTIGGPGTLEVSNGQVNANEVSPNSLVIHSGGKVSINAGAGSTSLVSSLSFDGGVGAWTGTLDIQDNDMIVQASAGNGATVLAAVTDQIRNGRNLNAPITLWDGEGITSTVAKTDASGLTSVGVIQNGADGVFMRTDFNGVPVDADSVLVKYTWNGDADLSGKVDADDYFRIDSAVGAAGALLGWLNGDFDYSGGPPDADDYFLIDSAFAGQTGVLGGGAGAVAVPEPGSLAMLALGGLALAARRRRNRH